MNPPSLFLFILMHITMCMSANSESTTDLDIGNMIINRNSPYCDDEKCTCPAELVLLEDKKDISCIDIKNKNFCMETENGFTLAFHQNDPYLFNTCLEFKSSAVSHLGFMSPRFFIGLYATSKNEQKRFAQWADTHKDILSQIQSWPTASANNAGEAFIVSESLGEYIVDILNPFPMPTQFVNYIERLPAPKIFKTMDSLLNYLENQEGKTDLSDAHFRFDARAEALIQFYKSDWSQNLADVWTQQLPDQDANKMIVTETLSTKGCSESCVLESSPKTMAHYTASYRAYLIENKIYRSEIILRESSSNIVGMIYLIDNYFLNLHLIDRDPFGIAKKITSYDAYGSTVHTHTRLENGEKIMEDRVQWLKNQNRFDYTIGLCENSISPEVFRTKSIAKNISFGPYTNTSYYGWSATATDPKQFWQGRLYLNKLDLPFSNFNYSSHALKVGEILVAESSVYDVGIIPLGIDGCMTPDTINTVWPEIKEHSNMRVVNMSLSHNTDETTCINTLSQHPITTDKGTLWVIAAGNNGSEKISLCPQYLSGRDNVIIVGSSRYGYMDETSNRGDHFVDIAASGYEQIPKNDKGTSYAAPRVARAAAKIFHDYPKLTVEQVKQALLLGAHYVSDTFPVRSRGEFDEDRALDYAHYIANGESVESAISNTECTWTSWCHKATQKLEIYQTLFNKGL